MTPGTMIGIDCRGGYFHAARLRDEAGRPSVETLTRVALGQLAGIPALIGARAVFSVPDNDVMTKWLPVPRADGIDSRQLCRFELTASLLEPEERFAFDIVMSGENRRFLGLTYRRERLAVLDDLYGLGHSDGYSVSGYRARGVALGRGYINFCRLEAGELICLIDLSDNACSVCLVHRRDIVGLAHLPVREPDFARDDWVRRLAIECKTVINFKLSSLSTEGITVPMSTLLVCGERIDERVKGIFAQYFPAGVASPRLNDAYRTESAPADVPQDSFLVAMGLTVN